MNSIRKKFSLENFIFVFICFNLILPGKFQILKFLLWFPIVIMFLLKLKKINLQNRKIIIWILIYTLSNLIFMFIGLFNGSQEVFQYYGLIYLVFPWVYYFIFICPLSVIDTTIIHKALKCSFYVVTIFIFIIIICYKVHLLPSVFEIKWLGLVINNNFNYLNFSLPAIISLFFLMPYFLCVTLLDIIDKKFSKSDIITLIVLIISLINMMLFGRRALMLTSILSIIIVLFLNYTIDKTINIKLFKYLSVLLFFFISFFILSNIFNWELRLSADFFTSGNNERISQTISLLEEWLQKPIFGHGIGINASVIRSDIPGTYELTYIALLFQTGLVGFIIRIGLYSWIIFKFIHYIKTASKTRNFYISVLVAFISILIANATNPYLDSYDFLLFMMIPLAIINKKES